MIKRFLLLVSLMSFLQSQCFAQYGIPEIPPGAPVQNSGEQPVILEIGSTYDFLSNVYADWQEYYLSGIKIFGKGQSIYGRIRHSNRFNLSDQELFLGGYAALSKDSTLNLEAGWSPEHRFFPSWQIGAEYNHHFPVGWGLFLGAHHRQYNVDNVNIENIGIERYWGKFRAAYTFYLSQLEIAKAGGSSHSTQLNYYYHEKSTLGLGLSIGREVENTGNNRLLFTDVKSANIFGTHWINSIFGLSYGVGLTNHHPIYTRKTYKLGFFYQF